MNVEPGTRLGPYEIAARVGAGGMGEVWRARDTRLDRDVAVKILTPAMADDRQLRARFEREAKTISQLSHPHICTLFDVGEGYLVMELLDGETLAQRIRQGPLPLTDVLRFGQQIAEGLDAAHRHGVIHRDLKPGNIMLTRSGAKLLDFGLARTRTAALGPDAPTQQRSITEEGMTVGTLQYMAPEQLDGQETDARTDIFALGSVLYEMATGRRAFRGDTRTEVILAIASTDPPSLSEVRPQVPARLEQVVQSCLAKRPDDRMQSAHDVALELQWTALGTREAVAVQTPPGTRRSSRREWAAWILAAVLAIALGAALVDRIRSRPAPSQPIRLTLAPPPQTTIMRTAAISPDGARVAFRATDVNGRSSLWLRSLDSAESTQLAGTGGAEFAFWSPDSRHIGFLAGRKLKRLDTSNGSIRTLHENGGDVPGGATWNAEDVIVFSPVIDGGLFRIPASGGEARPLPGKEKPIHAWPSFLPDGRHFLYVVAGATSGLANAGIWVGSLDSAQTKRLVPFQTLYDITPVHYAAGHLFYLQKRNLVARPFDAEKLLVTGDPLPVDESIEHSGPGRSPLSVSRNGTVIYRRSGPSVVSHLVIVNRSGEEISRIESPAAWADGSISPDGERVLTTRRDDIEAVWMVDVLRGSSSRMAFENVSMLGFWLEDGKSFAYSGSTDSPPNVYLRRADGTTLRLTKGAEPNYVSGVSPDGRQVLYTAERSGNYDIHAVPTTPPHQPRPVLHTPFGESDGTVSPDGRWLAYTSNESGRWQVYVTTFPTAGTRWPVSTERGDNPRWSRDGRELYYTDPARKRLYAVKVTRAAEGLDVGRPEALFDLPSSFCEVFRDGRFLVAKPSLNTASPPLSVVVNWRPSP